MKKLSVMQSLLILICIIIIGLIIYHIRIKYNLNKNNTVDKIPNVISNVENIVYKEVIDVNNKIPKNLQDDIKEGILSNITQIAQGWPEEVKNAIQPSCKKQGETIRIVNNIDPKDGLPYDGDRCRLVREWNDDDFDIKVYNANPDEIVF